MRARRQHSWNLSPKEAVRLQKQLAADVSPKGNPAPIRTVAGADIALDKGTNRGFVAVRVYSLPDLTLREEATAEGPLTFPYVPGLLSFREGPLLTEALERLKKDPDLLIFDGQGIAHPRSIGIASHMGLIFDVPTIGCAKSRLCGEHKEPGKRKGDTAPLMFQEKEVGKVLTTRDGCKPIYISPGHKISIDSAVKVIMSCVDGYRIPKPTREADHRVGQLKRSALAAV